MVILTQKDYDMIPKMEAKEAVYNKPWFHYNTIHFTIENVTYDDFIDYRRLLEKAGYEIYDAHDRGIHDAHYMVVYQKDGKELSLMYYVPAKKIWAGLSKDEYRAQWTAEDLFDKIPSMSSHKSVFHTAEHYGAGNYVVQVDYASKEDYKTYLELLESQDFVKYVENEEGINGEVFCVNYTKENLVVTVTYLEKLSKMYVSATFEQPLSEHLLYDEKFAADNPENAKTTLHFLNLEYGGNGLIWKLKNGHFVLSDCGVGSDIDMVFDYLEKETPKGEKPVIEGWFISHGHEDHCGAFGRIASNPEKYAGRVYLDGVYYSEPKDLVFALDGFGKGPTTLIKDALQCMKTKNGTKPVIYRTHMGERYYFNDITVDIAMAQEQLPYDYYCGDMNDSSTWCMFNVEGQKCLFGGDGDRGGMRVIMRAYARDYMKVDIFTLLHHGWATRPWFTDHCQIETVLVTVTGRGETPPSLKFNNDYQKEKCKEWLTSADGTKVFTFPYEVGSYEHLKE